MSVFKSVLNFALLASTVSIAIGCVPEDPEPGQNACTAGETRPADDGCNTCTCQDDGSWACTEIGCGPVCEDHEVLVDGECRTGCYGDNECGVGAGCNAEDVCLAPPGAGDGDVPAVCYGYCEPVAPPACEPVACLIACEHGFQQDENGCEICECAPPPACLPVECDLHCEHGWAQDEHGCEICECAPPPACLPVECDLHCEHGWAQDEHGCDTCACAEPPACEPVTCEIACEHGWAQDEHGCDICACAEPPACEPVTCEIACEFGFQQDENGCDICACAEPPACEPVDCEIACEFGFQQDENGCDICACAEPPACEPVACEIACEFGFQQDENGCDICACAEPPMCAEPDAPYYYVGNSPEDCAVLDFACAEGAEYFANDCGCGCVGAECFPGDQRPADDGCNSCECTEDGAWACTELACPEPEECAEGEFFYEGACRMGCYGDQECGEGKTCNAHTLCLAPPVEGGGDGDPIGVPAVCYGYCE